MRSPEFREHPKTLNPGLTPSSAPPSGECMSTGISPTTFYAREHILGGQLCPGRVGSQVWDW
jgi:hypothetical protein